MRLHLGLDIGSISVNTVLFDEELNIGEEHYTYCHGKPFHSLKGVLDDVLRRHKNDTLEHVAITGTGGKLAAELIGGYFVNEIIAQSSAVARLHPEARSVIEMGGEDSKLVFMEKSGEERVSRLSDFAMNTICAAGTGSFLDQQAKRLGVSIEREFGELALKSKDPPRIAGRCSVFAKSDMIHLQQIATPVEDIVAGLCFAVARNVKSNLARGKELLKPVVFQGGVAANQGMVRAFQEVLNLDADELIIPARHASMGAIGAVFYILDHLPSEKRPFRGLDFLDQHLRQTGTDNDHLKPLDRPDFVPVKDITPPNGNGGRTEVYLGLDVGSLSTNVVLIDKDNNVVARRYLPTAGKPLEAIRRGLSEIDEEVGARVKVIGAGTTGSGRYLTGDFIGADTIQNEITAQATAAIHYDPEVDTVFEIGGQDSKYIRIDDGVIVDFEMNKVCAAGTGSFLEEQAEKLDISIIDEFGERALDAEQPAHLGDRCTVFMESDLNSHQQKGVSKENLIGGLAYSIVYNYLQKVVGEKGYGKRIFFQGGVANNPAVVSAFQAVVSNFGEKQDYRIMVPPHFDVTGAIGAAMLARRELGSNGQKTRFKGFGVSNVPYSLDKFTCHGCANQCEIRKVIIEGEQKPLFYGGRCERYEIEERKGKGKDIPNLFERRLELLMGDFEEEPKDERITIGIPRGLQIFYQQFPFWRTFFRELGFRIVLSRPSDRQLVTKSLEMLVAETCFPVEVMHGHIHDLMEERVDYIFMPFVVDAKAEKGNPTVNYNCPWVESYPFMIRGSLKGDAMEEKLLIPTLHFRYFGGVLNRQLAGFMKERFGISAGKTIKAVKKADAAQEKFEEAVFQEGQKILNNLPKDKRSMVVLGRPYNTGDPELNLGLIKKLINLDVMPIPLDFLPLREENIFDDYNMMYWPNGQKILAGARIIARDDRMHAVYLSNFRCGPDSFLLHYVRDEMKGKPYLQLEVDEHSADAGMITRCEAFLDSLHGKHAVIPTKKERPAVSIVKASPSKNRTLYFPYMCDSAYILAAASRCCGIDADVLPMQDAEDLKLGREQTSSRECFPMICTTGSFLKKAREPGFDPGKNSFFMPSHNGPCRFGQYHKLQRIIFERLGYGDVEIISPNNKNSYADFSRGQGIKFRLVGWKGAIATDILMKLRQERKPYEKNDGEVESVYQTYLDKLVRSVESGAWNIKAILREAIDAFDQIELEDVPRKPIVAIVGEIFMRDNPYCSGYLVQKLQQLGAETVMAPVREWVSYSTVRFTRDSIWRGETLEVLKSYVQGFFQSSIGKSIESIAHGSADVYRDVPVDDMLELCDPYIHRDYDGDPPLAFGMAAGMAKTGISGIANILPFTCLPGTLITSISAAFRKDNAQIPWVDIAYDGQEDTAIETRLQAFVFQAKEYAKKMGYDKPRVWAHS